MHRDVEMNKHRLYFGDYCGHKSSRGPCLEETDKKCTHCSKPRCRGHLKNGLCILCFVDPTREVDVDE